MTQNNISPRFQPSRAAPQPSRAKSFSHVLPLDLCMQKRGLPPAPCSSSHACVTSMHKPGGKFHTFHMHQTCSFLCGPRVSPHCQPLPLLIQLLLATCPHVSSDVSQFACNVSSVWAIVFSHSTFLHHCTPNMCPRCLEFFAEASNHF